jgi:hypothetical protein
MERNALIEACESDSEEIDLRAREVVRKAIKQRPGSSSAELATNLIDELDSELLESVAGMLLASYFFRIVNSERLNPSQADFSKSIPEIKTALEAALFERVASTPVKIPSLDVAEDFIGDHLDLIEPLVIEWAIEKLARDIAKCRLRLQYAQAKQGNLAN